MQTAPLDSQNYCYLLKSHKGNRSYVGYTTDLSHRLRQHNGEITGGAKRTRGFRPWFPICLIFGFQDHRQALRFEWRWHHPPKNLRSKYKNCIMNRLNTLQWILTCGDKTQGQPWPPLGIVWVSRDYIIHHPVITNYYNP